MLPSVPSSAFELNVARCRNLPCDSQGLPMILKGFTINANGLIAFLGASVELPSMFLIFIIITFNCVVLPQAFSSHAECILERNLTLNTETSLLNSNFVSRFL